MWLYQKILPLQPLYMLKIINIYSFKEHITYYSFNAGDRVCRRQVLTSKVNPPHWKGRLWIENLLLSRNLNDDISGTYIGLPYFSDYKLINSLLSQHVQCRRSTLDVRFWRLKSIPRTVRVYFQLKTCSLPALWMISVVGLHTVFIFVRHDDQITVVSLVSYNPLPEN